MEQKGIRTDKGGLNRWIRKTNAMLREAKTKIASLLAWLKEVKDYAFHAPAAYADGTAVRLL